MKLQRSANEENISGTDAGGLRARAPSVYLRAYKWHGKGLMSSTEP